MGKIDGKPYAVEASPVYDHIAYTKKNDQTNELTPDTIGRLIADTMGLAVMDAARNRAFETPAGDITVAADGKSRVVTVHWTGDDGKKMTSKAVYNKE